MMTPIIRCSLTKEEIYHNLYMQAQEGTYVSYLRGKRCATEESFFHEVSASFQFPYYFGENWAAFDECICDLEWLNFKRIFIVIDDFDSLFSSNKETQQLLIKYLTNMVTYWAGEGVSVEIWLNSTNAQ